MAEDIKKILEIQFKGQQSIGDVKKEVAQLKKELESCAAGSDAAAKKSLELAQAEQTLKAATRGVIVENGKLDNSYNGLVIQMNKLKAAQKQVDISTRAGRKEYTNYAKEINKLNDKLKGLDASNGVFGRNVGNYANSIKTAFSGMGGAVGGVFTSISSGLKMLATNPWVAILTGIVAALKGLVDAFKRNEDAMLKVNLAFNKFKAVITLVQRGFDTLVSKITDGGSTIKNAVNTIVDGFKVGLDTVIDFGMKAVARVKSWFSKDSYEEILQGYRDSWEAVKTGIEEQTADIKARLDEITRREKAYAENHIKVTTEIASNNEKIAELNAKAADRESYTVEERRKASEEAAKLQKENLALEKKELQEQLAILKLRHSLTESNNEDLQEEADLKAQIIEKEAQMNEVERNLAQQQKTFDEEYLKETREALDARKKVIEQELAETQNGTERHLELTKEKLAIEKALEIADAENKIKDKEKLEEALALINETYNKKEIQAEKQHNLDLVEIRTQELSTEASLLSKGSQEYFDKVAELKKYVLDNIVQLDGETDAAFNERLAQAIQNYNKAVEAAKQNTAKSQNQRANNTANSQKLEQGSSSLQYYEAELEAARLYYDSLFQLQDESNEDYEARQIAALQSIRDKEKQLNTQRINNYLEVGAGIASIMSTVADAWEDSIKRQVEEGKISQEEGEKEFENVKALQYAIAGINTISGAIAAFMKSQELGQPWGMIIGAVQAAAVTAAGVAEMMKIKNTTLGSSATASAGGASAFQLPSLESYSPEYTRNLTGENDIKDIGSTVKNAIEGASIKAYVVESDITGAQKKSSKRMEESTW